MLTVLCSRWNLILRSNCISRCLSCCSAAVALTHFPTAQISGNQHPPPFFIHPLSRSLSLPLSPPSVFVFLSQFKINLCFCLFSAMLSYVISLSSSPSSSHAFLFLFTQRDIGKTYCLLSQQAPPGRLRGWAWLCPLNSPHCCRAEWLHVCMDGCISHRVDRHYK